MGSRSTGACESLIRFDLRSAPSTTADDRSKLLACLVRYAVPSRANEDVPPDVVPLLDAALPLLTE